MSDTYEKTYAQSLNEPESFWASSGRCPLVQEVGYGS